MNTHENYCAAVSLRTYSTFQRSTRRAAIKVEFLYSWWIQKAEFFLFMRIQFISAEVIAGYS